VWHATQLSEWWAVSYSLAIVINVYFGLCCRWSVKSFICDLKTNNVLIHFHSWIMMEFIFLSVGCTTCAVVITSGQTVFQLIEVSGYICIKFIGYNHCQLVKYFVLIVHIALSYHFIVFLHPLDVIGLASGTTSGLCCSWRLSLGQPLWVICVEIDPLKENQKT